MSTRLRFRTITTSVRTSYVAQTPTRIYIIWHRGRGDWALEVSRVRTVAGVNISDLAGRIDAATTSTKGLAVAVAHAYRDLGDDYQPHEHGYRERMTEAIGRAYAEEAAQ